MNSISIFPRKVRCIDTRKIFDQIDVGEDYILDLHSIWMDSDGTAYGMIYTLNWDLVGQLKLSHFTSSIQKEVV